MIDPYEALGLDHDADPEAIRRRYLELVRRYPPEREPERFARIREAYDRLRDPVIHLENRLFNLQTTATFDSLLAEVKADVREHRIPTNLLLSLGRP